MKRPMLLWMLAATAAFCSTIVAANHADAAILAGNHPAAVETYSAIANAELTQPLAMDVRFNLRNAADLSKLIAAQHDPSSPQYHQWLKTGEFDERFGPLPSDVNAVASWLASEGFTVESTDDGHVQFSGNVAQAQRSFAVHIARLGDGSFYGNTDDPTIPAQFAGMIAAIRGLDNIMRIKPAGLQMTPPVSSALSTRAEGATPLFIDSNDIEAFGPQDMRTFYNETVQTGSDGTGSCIGLIGVSEIAATAVSVFDKEFKLPAIKLTQSVTGGKGIQTGDDSQIEAELDVEWAHAIAPGAGKTLYLAPPTISDPLATAIGAAVKANTCSTISISFSYCGAPNSEFTSVLDPLFQRAASQGQSVFVSSGDQGAAGIDGQCDPTNSRGINEMSADPYVTSVGGTETSANYDQHGNATGYTTEEAWNSDGGATGGGESGVFAKPSYQTGPGVPSDTNRDIPDIALLASPTLPGVFLGDTVVGPAEVRCCIGGTSLSSPMMAAMVEILDQQVGRLGVFNQMLYPLANQQYASSGPDNGFHDVTIGNNNFAGSGVNVTGFNAGSGYDQTTGWGSIDFDVFASAVKATAPPANTTLTPAPGAINFGNVNASGTSKAHRVTIVNKGGFDATIGMLSISSGYAIVSGTDTCSGQTIVNKKSCTVSIEFTPSTPGSAPGTLTIPYNGTAPATVNLSGNGTAVVLRKPAAVNFAAQPAGTTSRARNVVIMNPSTTATVVLSPTSLSGPFTTSSDTCTGATLAPHARCMVSLVFSPPDNSPSKTPIPGDLNYNFTYGVNPGSAPVTLSGMVK